MSFLVPYSPEFRLGAGFNSYSQECKIEDAVLIVPREGPRLQNLPTDGTATPNSTTPIVKSELATSSVPEKEPPPARNLSQIVTYSSRFVEDMNDVVDALNISAASSIKYGTIKGTGSTSYVNENKIVSSDINMIITVRVTNPTSTIPDEMTFQPMEGLDPARFTEVYGDCFISGFIEGGEFSAIISIKVNDKSKVSAVKAAAEASVTIPPAPGLSVEAKAALDKNKSNVWKDTETTISVNWSGGGEIKDAAARWDLSTVIDVASKFPHMVQNSAQRISAILTRYTSLRSFVAANAKMGGNGYVIKNYNVCSLYTQDLFSAYCAYKVLWARISDILKHPNSYQEREKSKEIPDPVQINPKSLNGASLLARKAMTIISDETARLVQHPELADVDVNNNARPLPYSWPEELAIRLPKKPDYGTIEQIDGGEGRSALTPEEITKIGRWTRRDDIRLSPLCGDPPPPKESWFDRGKNTLFCTLDSNPDANAIDALTKLRLHAHQHHHGDIFGDFHAHSKTSEGYLSAIGFSTTRDVGTTCRSDGTNRHVGRPNDNGEFWSRLADPSVSKVAKVLVEYFPTSGKIAGIALMDSAGNEITSWKQYGQAKTTRPEGLKVETQLPPDARGAWNICGWWGHSDAIVMTRIGAIWKRS